MKTTTYFREQVLRKRSYLRSAWIEQVISQPEQRSVQQDGRVRFWGWVPQLGHWLRVVTLEDGETVHNAFRIETTAQDSNHEAAILQGD